jgi:hypothetical protein
VSHPGVERDKVAKFATDSPAGLRTVPGVTKRDETIKERLERFTPRALSSRSWANARGAAVGAVLAASPCDETRAVCLLSRLCTFLASHPSSAGDALTDLATLLTPASIDAFVSERLRRGERRDTIGVYRTDLRHIARAIGTMAPVVPSGRSRTCAPGAAFWSSVVDEGPLKALVAAYETKGTRFEGKTWDGVGDLFLDLAGLLGDGDEASAGSDALTTIAAVRNAAARWRTAADAEVALAVPASAASGRKASGPQAPAHRVSPTRAARAARAAYAAAQERPIESTAPGLAVVPPLDGELAAAVVTWRPRKIALSRWARVEATPRLLIRAFGPPSRTWLSCQAGYLARFCVWVASRPEREDRDADLRPDEVLDLSLVERFLADAMADHPVPSRSTARSVLRRAVQNLSSAPRPERIPHAPVQPPYTPQECAAFVRLARNQPTRARRRALGAVVALGLGAGLDGTEQGKVTPRHIVEVDLGDQGRALGVNVPGPRSRLVIVRSSYEELLREVLAIHRAERRGEDRPLYGNDPNRRNVTGAARTQAVTANGRDVELSASRLRATWLVAPCRRRSPSARSWVPLACAAPAPSSTSCPAARRPHPRTWPACCGR